MAEFSQILRRARDGEAAALSDLYARFHGTVERAASGGLGARLHRQFDTADIVQSVFADLLRDLPRIEDRGEAAFRGWLTTAVVNKVRMKARRQTLRSGLRRETRLSTDAGSAIATRGPGPDIVAAERDEVAHLSRLLGSVSAEQRDVICLRVDEGMSWSDVARALDLPTADAARVRYVRALYALRDRF
jgi:RNA polymerase sigma-70 factor (ECF subfamily)